MAQKFRFWPKNEPASREVLGLRLMAPTSIELASESVGS